MTVVTPLRSDLALIASLIAQGSRVLDLGCADGSLLRHIIDHDRCTGTGVDTDPDSVLGAIRSGVPLIELDVDSDLGMFADDSYDVVVLSRTLQTVRKPSAVLTEMARIAPRCIVSMPNFGYWRNRVRLARGWMPRSKDLPYEWHDTPNIHHATLHELEDLFTGLGLTIAQRVPLRADGRPAKVSNQLANLAASSAVYVLTR